MSKPLLRQRSRDLTTWKDEQQAELLTDDKNNASPPKPTLKLRSFVVIGLSLFVAIGLLLTRWRFVLDASNLLGGSSKIGEAITEHSDFDLHPQAHAYRDPKTIKQTWIITSDLRRPDGVLKRTYLVNDAFPSPTLEARSGDRVIIQVINALGDEGVSIHWHGLSMTGANAMDGAVGVTQDPIAPGESFEYNFTIADDEHGTFWYHAHDGLQRADGLYGGLVVHKPADRSSVQQRNHEKLLLIGDWYHRPGQEAHDHFSHPGAFGNEPVPDSILLQGKGVFNCSNAVPARPLDCVPREVGDLVPVRLRRDQRTILRVVNTGSYAGVDLAIENAALTPVAVDGGNPVEAASARRIGYLYPGERVDLVVEPDTNANNHHSLLSVSLDDTPFKEDNPALTPVHHFPVEVTGSSSHEHSSVEAEKSFIDLNILQAAVSSTLPAQAQETIILYTTTQKLSRLENQPLGFINHTTWQPMSTPLTGLPRSSWDKNQLVPHLPVDRTVDIILNNLDEEAHHFHLHGFSFSVLSTYSSDYNWGSYNPYVDADPPGGAYNLQNPLRKDTVLVPRRGYAVLRFDTSDHRGIWMFHCHVLWHQAAGMAMAFEVS